MLKRGNFKRNNLFCNNCIAWAKGEIRKSQQQGTSSQQPPQPPQPPPEEPQYSPISEPCNSRDTPDPFKDILLDSMNDPMIVDADSTTVNRLTLPNSPLHLGNHKYSIHYMLSAPILNCDISSVLFQQCHL